MDEASLLDMVGLIYDASLDGDWSCVIANLVERLASDHVALLVNVAGGLPMPVGANPDLELRYVEQYAPMNHAAPVMLRHTLYDPLIDAMLLDMEAHRTTLFYNEFLRPNGMKLLAGGAAFRADGVSMGLSVGRGSDARPYGRDDLATIAALLPHLGRAFQVQRRLGAADQANRAQHRATAEVLDRLSFAAFHVDGQGRVVEANAAADALLRAADGLLLGGGRLVASDPAQSVRLAAAIRSATRRSGFTLGPQEMLLLPRPSGRAALLVDVLPIPPGPLWDARPVCLLFVAESDAMPQSAGEMLRELFGLTPSEVRLALLLGSGEGLAGLAERLGTRLATTRSHLAGALAKTGLHRQAELVRLVERCAAVSRRRA